MEDYDYDDDDNIDDDDDDNDDDDDDEDDDMLVVLLPILYNRVVIFSFPSVLNIFNKLGLS